MLANSTTFEQTEWGSMTSNRAKIAKDAEFQQKMKQLIKYYAYTTAGSNAMNGITSDTELVYVRTWWQNALRYTTIGAGALTALLALLWLMSGRKGRKEQ